MSCPFFDPTACSEIHLVSTPTSPLLNDMASAMEFSFVCIAVRHAMFPRWSLRRLQSPMHLDNVFVRFQSKSYRLNGLVAGGGRARDCSSAKASRN